MQFTKEQEAAIRHGKGPAQVVAVPGAGKTRVIVSRAMRLVEQGTPPDRLLLVTFTRKAAQEMEGRLTAQGIKGTQVMTLHGFCYAALKKEWHNLEHPLAGFEIIAPTEQQFALRAAMSETNYIGRTEREMLDEISKLKSLGWSDREWEPTDKEERKLHAVWTIYEEKKRLGFKRRVKGEERTIVTREYDDLLLDALWLFEHHRDILEDYRARFAFIMVDECQDLNWPQWQLVEWLAGPKMNLMVVGDPDQGLYEFRFARPELFLTFHERHKNTKRYLLSANFRSQPAILRHADLLIKKNQARFAQTIQPVRPEGPPPECRRFGTPDDEAEFAAQEISRLAQSRELPWKEFAVLVRTNGQLEAFESAFARHSIPFLHAGDGTGTFYDRREIVDILSYLSLLSNPKDSAAFERIANRPNRFLQTKLVKQIAGEAHSMQLSIPDACRGINVNARQREALNRFWRDYEYLLQSAYSQPEPRGLIRRIRQGINYNDFVRKEGLSDNDNDALQNLDRLEEVAAAQGSVDGLLNHAEEVRRKAKLTRSKKNADAVLLSTGHRSKGLEWTVVFAAGWADKLLPHSKSEPGSEEERRIAYVMLTRAKDLLYVTCPSQFAGEARSASPFIREAGLMAVTFETNEVEYYDGPEDEEEESENSEIIS